MIVLEKNVYGGPYIKINVCVGGGGGGEGGSIFKI